MSVQKIITKDKSPRWEVRFYVNGRGSKRITRRFTTKVQAEAYLFERAHEKKRSPVIDGASLQPLGEATFQVEAEFWLNFHRSRFSEGHFINAKLAIEKLLPKFGGICLEQFHPGVLSTIQSELLESSLKPASVNRYFQVILAILNFSVKQRRIRHNPSHGFQKLKEVRDDICFWEKHEAIDFLKFANQKYPFGSSKRWIYVVYLFAINTAARAGEIWGLKPGDIRQDGEVILIQRQLNRISNDFSPTKGRKNRRLPCNSDLRSELKSLIASNSIADQETVFQTETRKPVSHRNFSKRIFQKDLEEWGGKKIRFHDLRHTAATLMAAAGIDLRTVQEICGHQSIQTTMNYAHMLAERIRDTARSFAIVPQANI
jgi:integrase